MLHISLDITSAENQLTPGIVTRSFAYASCDAKSSMFVLSASSMYNIVSREILWISPISVVLKNDNPFLPKGLSNGISTPSFVRRDRIWFLILVLAQTSEALCLTRSLACLCATHGTKDSGIRSALSN